MKQIQRKRIVTLYYALALAFALGSVSLFPLAALAQTVPIVNQQGNTGEFVNLAMCTGGQGNGRQISISSVSVASNTCVSGAAMVTLDLTAEANFQQSFTDVYFIGNTTASLIEILGSEGWIFDPSTRQYISDSEFAVQNASGTNNAQVCMVDPGSSGDSSLCSCSAPFNLPPPPCEPPIANAGLNQTVHGNLVTLDGSGSYDPSGLPLTYAWSFSSTPAGSTAVLSNPAAVNPTFTADLPGNYVVQLIVTNSAGVASAPSSVTISTTNTAPIASAGPDQAVTLIGGTIQLDGSQSYDPDGDTLTYAWTFFSRPVGSEAILAGPTTTSPTFIADVHGTYVVQLIVSDPWVQSAPATVTISFNNVAPVANAGTSQSAIVGDTVTLNGSGSSDANADPLTYKWSLAHVPTGSVSGIASPTSMVTTFVPDLPGLYVAQLIVNDGFVDSVPSTVNVQVISDKSEAMDAVRDLEAKIAALDPASFKNPNMKNALINKLNAVLANISDDNYADALDQLQNDILGKMNGCATGGAPDKNDWIINCQGQDQVYPSVVNLIQLIQNIK